MIVVNGVIASTLDNINATRDAIAKMEEASRGEEGCHDYTFSVELNEPTMLRITECWESMEHLVAHFATPHMAEFRAALAAHPPTSLDVTFYEATEVTPPR